MSQSSQQNSPNLEIDLYDLGRNLFARRRLILSTVAAVMIVTALYTLTLPNRYRSQASILPSGRIDNMAELKNMAGLAGSGITDQNSSELYPVILRSRSIQDAVLDEKYWLKEADDSTAATLSEFFAEYDPDLLRRQLSAITSVAVDLPTGVINLAVETTNPMLSRGILAEYVEQLEKYNRHKRRSREKENAEYLERQLEVTSAELESAEDRLQQFQQVNQNWAGSADPVILRELARFRRDIEIKSKTFQFLMQEHEIARLEARKDVPVVRLLDPPSLPTLKSGPYRRNMVILSGTLTLAAMLFLTVIIEAFSKRRQLLPPQALDTLRQDLSQAFPRSKRVLNLIRKTTRRKPAVAKKEIAS